MPLVRVLLADDHTLVRSGVRRLLEDLPGVEVVAEAADGDQAFELAQRLRPDLAFLDLSMPGMEGLETAYRMRRELPGVRLISCPSMPARTTCRPRCRPAFPAIC